MNRHDAPRADTRRRVRRWILWGGAPFALVALVVVAKILSMYAFAHQTITSTLADDAPAAIRAAQGQAPLNWFEPYKAPYNLGVALAAAERLPESRAKLEEALALANGLEECPVRVNLALVIERLGDAARGRGEPDAAAELYAEAMDVTLATPDECRTPEADEQSPDPERSTTESLERLEDRLLEKQGEQQDRQDQQSPPPSDPQPEPSPPTPSPDQLQELEDRLTDGAREREERGEEPPGTGVERPW
ncbi:tetratricopeptide repeat protein [Microbacterium album]|uniref:Tetratricopeptide repeat protein n=1 Tax=Microbacterium album TaxID=2053191 RepID=A0A917IJ37_9MICO|nr:tetratricopeptide repeat protein [Microbacterium album]GGH50331.1 hypothetical protein GCM10010921_29020 [Microbacterium album]